MDQKALKLPIGVVLGKTLRQLHLAMQKRLNKELSVIDLTIEHLRLLKIISDNPGCDQNFLARSTQRGKSSMTRIIATMIDNGYLTKTSSQQDGRAKLIFVTDKGKTLAGNGIKILRNVTDELFGSNEEEIKVLIDLANKTIKKLK
ncbi:MAG: MarR family transcriptional regulator [Bacteroidota bacterium]